MSDLKRSSRSLDRDEVLPDIDKMEYKELISYAYKTKTKKHNLKSTEDTEKTYAGPHTQSRASSTASSIASNAIIQTASPESPPPDNNQKEITDESDVFIIKNLLKELAEQRDAFRFFSRREMMGNNPFRITNGHLWDECPERKIVCPFCGGDHKSTECEKPNEPKCIDCEGAHPSFSLKCPERMKIFETSAETAPITPPKVALLKNLPHENRLMIEHQLLMFMNLMPQNRDQIIKLN
ncbi:hypothetical protein JTB14_034846 [Gonioctena quinquepunctata]|nr:hypothetical protein JTB14_034846 [Gonioctena quinquepunctata]